MMWRFFVDESLPNLAVQRLREEGYVVESVRELNMQGATDEAVFAEAQKRQVILVTGDEDFADITRFPTEIHHGIIVVRLQGTKEQRVAALLGALKQLHGQPLKGVLVIVELGRIRVRKQAGI
jgi:predicted nuclease of predicted toxin-antitoxin system